MRKYLLLNAAMIVFALACLTLAPGPNMAASRVIVVPRQTVFRPFVGRVGFNAIYPNPTGYFGYNPYANPYYNPYAPYAWPSYTYPYPAYYPTPYYYNTYNYVQPTYTAPSYSSAYPGYDFTYPSNGYTGPSYPVQ